jgi:hypothetical protein
MNKLGVVIATFAGFLRREPSVGFRQVVNFVHEITFAQMRIEINNHRSPPDLV